MNTANKTEMKPSHEEIAAKASQLWEQGGRHSGKDLEYWVQAEKELLAAHRQGAQASCVSASKATHTDAKINPSAKPAPQGR